ncbi:MAG TPA: adenosine deaminase [Candidatus Eisenbacteria bacterium]|nr:adenosine deaminase [Candidatus Eisenbacteria bacterium]
MELHLQLDCSMSYEAVTALRPSLSRAEYEQDYVAPLRCTNLAEFLSRAPKGFELMQNEASLELVTEDLFRQLVDDGVIYAELRFAPLLHTEQGLTADRAVEVVDRATEKLMRETGVEARLILCTLRHYSAEQSMPTVRLLDRFRGSRVVALDLAADEAGFPLDAHIAAYEHARRHSHFRTAHAGEARGPESVWETLRLLQPSRIGHGTRSIEDPALVEHLRREAIHLELSPTANVQIIEGIDCWEDHPIDRLYRAGVRLNVNTDSRMLTPATLTGEYEGLQRVFGWGPGQLLQTNLMAVDAAFVAEKVKQRLRDRLRASYQQN